ncbi:replication initiation protein RepM [Psychrobacter sp. NC44]|uniref:replication initiation protein RepM n=1 Tax=Psychrobacter sp. NC44 TaxID=2774130 RepID=UPI00191B3D72|nr:replication initiation protein RepM [Psychrobacter sp. NC44]
MKSDKGKNMSDLVVKSNRLNTAIQNLSLVEIRLIQIAIIDSRETQTGLTSDSPLVISAKRYAECFNVEIDTAYDVLLAAESTLFERRFSFVNERDNQVKTRWVSQVEYIRGDGAIEVILTPAVVKEITRINGIENFFTKYTLGQTAVLNSAYSVRLYELVTQWRKATKTHLFDIETFRGQLGLGVNDYQRMSDFKRRVLDSAVAEINEKTDLKISYDQEKKKSKIIGFKFKVSEKERTKSVLKASNGKDCNTADMFTVKGLSDKQIGRIARNAKFMADYNHLVSSTSPAGQDSSAWEFEMTNRLKRDASQFKKRPIRDYLDL